MTQYKILEANQRKMLSVMGALDKMILSNLDKEEFSKFKELMQGSSFGYTDKDWDSNKNRVFSLSEINNIKTIIQAKDKDNQLIDKITYARDWLGKTDEEMLIKDALRTPFFLRQEDKYEYVRDKFYSGHQYPFYFTQGDFMGTGMGTIRIAISEKYTEDYSANRIKNLQFGYIDNDNNACGLCIDAFCSDSGSIEYYFSHVKNCNAAELEDRQQTVIYCKDIFNKYDYEPAVDEPAMLVPDDTKNEYKIESKDVSKADAFKKLQSVINSTEVEDFVLSFFDKNDNVNLDEFSKGSDNLMLIQQVLKQNPNVIIRELIEKFKTENPNANKDDDLHPQLLKYASNIEDESHKSFFYALISQYVDSGKKISLNNIDEIYKIPLHPVLDKYKDLKPVSDITKQAIEKLKKNETPIFDPQGRVLVEVDDCIVSLDVFSDETLKKKYYKNLKGHLDKYNYESSELVINKLKNLTSKNSIISLQQEMYFQISLALNVYKEQYKEIQDEGLLDATMQAVNDKVMQAFADALNKSSNSGTQDINLEVLNTELDNSRDKIAKFAHEKLVEKIKEKNIDLDLTQFNVTNARKDAKHTTATSKDIYYVDSHLKTLTVIEGSLFSSHCRKWGDDFANRSIKTYRIDDNLEVQHRLGGLQIRTPSLPVKEGLSEKGYIDDTKSKIEKLVSTYGLQRPFTYNLLTAMQHRMDDLGTKNRQTQSARHIILGAQAYNRQTTNSNFCLVQAISVNGFGKPLGYSYFGFSTSLPNEATLLAEMALCYNIGDKNVLDNYKTFLKSPAPQTFLQRFLNLFRSAYFVNSSEGQSLRKDIAAKKQKWQEEGNANVDDTAELVKLSIKKIMAFDLHFSHDYAKLIQALSLFIEDESIIGCKSGNERTPIIIERMQLLNKSELPKDLLEAFQEVAKCTEKSTAIKSLNKLKSVVNKHYNDENLYGASAMIPLVDQGAGHKIAASKGYTWSSNKAEDKDITNLKQKNTRKLQAHNGLTDYMNDAIQQTMNSINNEENTEQNRTQSDYKMLCFLGLKNTPTTSNDIVYTQVHIEKSVNNSANIGLNVDGYQSKEDGINENSNILTP